MESIRVNRILPAFLENEMDFDKVSQYAEEMKNNDIEMGHYGFPPIKGFFDVVNKEDLGKVFNWSNYDKSEKVVKKHLGEIIFRVTDGNHRTCAAQIANIWCLETESDNSGFVYEFKN